MKEIRSQQLLGRLLYGMLFVVLLPALLVVWAKLTDGLLPLPVPESPWGGAGVALIGFALMLSGMVALVYFGDGLPMNAYPPARYVHRGIYSVVAHPIYVGFILLWIGFSILFHSPGGLWLVSPVISLGCAALIFGYEANDIKTRFGAEVKRPSISLPADDARPPKMWERLSVYVLVFLPWVVAYESVSLLGPPPDAIIAYLPFEKSIPVYESTELFYASTYLIVLALPMVVSSARELRKFSIAGLLATALVTFLFLVVPFSAPPKDFLPTGILGSILTWERRFDTPAAAFPSFHVVWAFLAAHAFSKAFPSRRLLWWTWAVAVAASCILTGMHALVDVLAGMIVVPAILNAGLFWKKLRTLTERLANSWKEWQSGGIRIINHGGYPAAGTTLGLFIIAWVLGPGYMGYALLVAFSSLVVAALWAQYIEGSPSLLRPYGFYGGVLGVVIGSLGASMLGGDVWLLLASFSLVGPLIQATGRVRCLVQGCCHGRKASVTVGIRYSHPRSRVCKLAHLADVPIHPTPLYSILWNLFTGVILARLWSLHAPPTFVTGLFLILNGLGRFVEEAYRGEPQTPIVRSLRLYQWIAIASVVAGAVLTAVRTNSEIPEPQLSWSSLVPSVSFGLITWFAFGVDFPSSNRRFARLV